MHIEQPLYEYEPEPSCWLPKQCKGPVQNVTATLYWCTSHMLQSTCTYTLSTEQPGSRTHSRLAEIKNINKRERDEVIMFMSQRSNTHTSICIYTHRHTHTFFTVGRENGYRLKPRDICLLNLCAVLRHWDCWRHSTRIKIKLWYRRVAWGVNG